MKFTSLFTVGLLALGFILVAVLNDDMSGRTLATTPTTAGWPIPCSASGALRSWCSVC